MIISASIISADFTKFEHELTEIEKAGTDWLHFDVMDGSFVPNISIGPFMMDHCKKITSLPVDVHLMIVNPEKHIKTFVDHGASRIGIHIENNPNALRTIQEIKSYGVKAGIVLNPGTGLDAIEYILPFVDQVLIMTVNPGYSGQKFIPEMLPKIKQLRNRVDELEKDILIQVDGGINENNVSLVKAAGADSVVAATAIFKYPNGIQAGVNALRQ